VQGKPGGIGGGLAAVMVLIQYGIPFAVAASIWPSSWFLAIVVGIGLHVVINWAGAVIIGLLLTIGMAIFGRSSKPPVKSPTSGINSQLPAKSRGFDQDAEVDRDPAVR
jgi:hypothetical protein